MGREWLARRMGAGESGDVVDLGSGDPGGHFILRGRRIELFQLQFRLVKQPGGTFRARPIHVAAQLLVLQLQMGDQGGCVPCGGVGAVGKSPAVATIASLA